MSPRCPEAAVSVNFGRHGYGHSTVACAYLAGMPGCRLMSRCGRIQNTCQYSGTLLILTICASHSQPTYLYMWIREQSSCSSAGRSFFSVGNSFAVVSGRNYNAGCGGPASKEP